MRRGETKYIKVIIQGKQLKKTSYSILYVVHANTATKVSEKNVKKKAYRLFLPLTFIKKDYQGRYPHQFLKK